MKTICFPCTNRVHAARQGLLLKELGKHFNVRKIERTPLGRDMAEKADDTFSFFTYKLRAEKPDLVLIRADRFEMLPIAIAAAYLNIPIAHIEGGDVSSVIDGKVRHAISHLSDYHFPTNQDSHERLIRMGIPMNRIWNYGSLDTEFALQVKPKRLKQDPYILVTYHPVPGENPEELEIALKNFTYDIVRISSNSDYRRKYGTEEYSPEDYINLVRYAACCVGNSSSLFKEASVLGVGAVNIGTRQEGRLRTRNIIDVPCSAEQIEWTLRYQLGNTFLPDMTYYQPDTSKKIARKLKELLI